MPIIEPYGPIEVGKGGRSRGVFRWHRKKKTRKKKKTDGRKIGLDQSDERPGEKTIGEPSATPQ